MTVLLERYVDRRAKNKLLDQEVAEMGLRGTGFNMAKNLWIEIAREKED